MQDEITTPYTLKLRWAAAKKMLDRMQESYAAGRIDRAGLEAFDVAECNAYNAWQAAVEADARRVAEIAAQEAA